MQVLFIFSPFVLATERTDEWEVFYIVGFSPVEKFPQAEFSPYQKLNYEWNPLVSYKRIPKKKVYSSLLVVVKKLVIRKKNN